MAGLVPVRIPAMFVITEDVAAAILMKADGDSRDICELSEDERIAVSNTSEAYEVIAPCDGATSCSDFYGEAYRIGKDGETEKMPTMRFSSEGCDYIAGVACKKDSTLFKSAYASFDELVAEFRGKLAPYLPEGFPIGDHIFAVTGDTYVD